MVTADLVTGRGSGVSGRRFGISLAGCAVSLTSAGGRGVDERPVDRVTLLCSVTGCCELLSILRVLVLACELFLISDSILSSDNRALLSSEWLFTIGGALELRVARVPPRGIATSDFRILHLGSFNELFSFFAAAAPQESDAKSVDFFSDGAIESEHSRVSLFEFNF